MKATIIKYLVAIVLLISSVNSLAQISHGGIPYGLKTKTLRQPITEVTLAAPDYNKLRNEDDSLSSLGVPERMGVTISLPVQVNKSGTLTDISSTIRIGRFNVTVPGATGLAFYFSEFHLAPGDSLFIYSKDLTHYIGAFTQQNNKKNGLFATEEVKGESVIIELVDNKLNYEESVVNISDVLVAYTPLSFRENGIGVDRLNFLGAADTCEINVKCPEGDGWRDQINGVVRIKSKVGNNAFWCTGSIMNNTALDFTPFILTADHCATYLENYSSANDISQWVFYYNYESVSCENDAPAGVAGSMTGAVKISASTTVNLDGSDFLLLELDESIPNNYNPYYQGWDATGDISQNGVGIHHPEGDVKKISTYTRPLEISEWGENPGTHFLVYWSRTQNGYGVSEPGSSGSPLFNSQKYIIGTLTGGLSECTTPEQPDQYGRIFYSWDKNGPLDSDRLQPWLDPINTGLRVLEGSYNVKIAIAQFVADKTIIPVNSSVIFIDLSSNNPDTWQWHFEGGKPASSNSQNPDAVYYDKLGTYDVQLVVTNEFGTDSTIIENYIKVVPTIYPNPTRGNVSILLGNDEIERTITITTTLGKSIAEYYIPANKTQLEFSFLTYPAGIYIIGIQTGDKWEYHKILYSPN